MDSSNALDSTKETSNICSKCGDLDNTIHICPSDQQEQASSIHPEFEHDLGRSKKRLHEILKKVRETKQESQVAVFQVSEAQRILKLKIKARDVTDAKLVDLTEQALSWSLKVIELLTGLPEDEYARDAGSDDNMGFGSD